MAISDKSQRKHKKVVSARIETTKDKDIDSKLIKLALTKKKDAKKFIQSLFEESNPKYMEEYISQIEDTPGV